MRAISTISAQKPLSPSRITSTAIILKTLRDTTYVVLRTTANSVLDFISSPSILAKRILNPVWLIKTASYRRARLSEAYLGFIVVKPLHTNPIGRTCLRTYPESNNRKYPVLQTYEVGLYGHSLSVTSLAFQEQDRVVAACATSAILDGIARYGEEIPSHDPISVSNHSKGNKELNVKYEVDAKSGPDRRDDGSCD